MATLCCRLGHAGVPAGHAEELRKDLEAKLKQLKAIDDYVQGQMSRQASVLRSGACLAPGLACTPKASTMQPRRELRARSACLLHLRAGGSGTVSQVAARSLLDGLKPPVEDVMQEYLERRLSDSAWPVLLWRARPAVACLSIAAWEEA